MRHRRGTVRAGAGRDRARQPRGVPPTGRQRRPGGDERPLARPICSTCAKGWYLDFPGDALEPGCIFEQDFRRFFDGRSVVYAHVATQARRARAASPCSTGSSGTTTRPRTTTRATGSSSSCCSRPTPSSRRSTADPSRRRLRPAHRWRAQRLGRRQARQGSAAARSCTRPGARTPATTTRRCTSGARAARASAATTPTAPHAGSTRPW